MAAFKKIAAAALMMVLAVPAVAYGAGETEYSQPIRDIKQQQAGVFQCEKNTEEWTKEVVLTASAVPDSGKTLPEFSFLWQGAKSTGDGVYTVKENGTYTVKLQLPEDSGLKAEDIQVDVQNIDILGPEIINITKDISGWTSGPVKITVDCEDYQTAAEENAAKVAERAKGSGLHPEGAYSFDGGKTWTKDNFITVEDNTTIDFAVRDALENVTKQNITVDNIDKSQPSVRVNIADGGVLYEGEGGSVLLSASASDNSSGLHAQPYSWDGGVSWTGEATHAVTSAGDYTVFVRDNAGNYTQVTLTVSYAQRPQQNSGGSGAGSSSAGNNTYMSAGSESIYYGVPAAPIAGNSTNVNTNRVNGEKETKETEKTEDRETESKKETESKESETLKTPLMSDGTSSGFPIRWILIIIAAVAIIIGVVVASKLISDRQAAAGQWDDDDEPDMSKVYARVSANESQTLKKAAAAASASAVIASKVEDEAKEETPVPETVSKAAPEVVDEPTVRVAAPEIAAAAAATEAAPEEVDEPTVRVAAPEIAAAAAVTEAAPEEVDEPTVRVAAPEIAETAAVSEAVSEAMDEAKVPGAAPEPVVLEGAHSRLIYDPATGEYKYELK